MAALKHFQDMNDPALKPHMLRTLIRRIPDQNTPLDSSFKLTETVSLIRTHDLLAEYTSDPVSEKLIQDWKSAVDDWVNALLLLVSGTSQPDKRLVGIYLLRVTCQRCRSDRFLSSYSNWFHKLLSYIQPAADSQSVKEASCSSLSAILSRVAKYPNEKKEGNSHAGKLIQPILKLLNGDGTEKVWEEAINLLHLMINTFPTSVRQSYDQVEATICSKILLGKCNKKLLKKLGNCLAVLPKAKGDESSWGMLMEKILLLINEHLSDVFHGVEEEMKSLEAKRLMLPPGKDLPPPLGGLTLSAVRENMSKSSERLLTSGICTLLICCCKMLTDSYPGQVNVPLLPLLALIERVLIVDGSLPRNRVPIVTTKQQELLCIELPVLHNHCLQLLSAITKGMHSQLLPHVAYVAKLVMKYFKKCRHPELRIKLYSIAKMLLLSMGVGMAVYLSHDVVDNAFADLNPKSEEKIAASTANIKSSTETLPNPFSRKRKHPTKTGAFEKQKESTGVEVEPNKHWGTPVSVKIAALQAVTALFLGGATAKSGNWRSKLDHLLISVAIESCKGGWANEESSPTLADFQFTSLNALSVSLCAPAGVRSPHLAKGVELFHKGKREAGPRISECCADALFRLELVIHPRALPPQDFQPPSDAFLSPNTFSGLQKQHHTIGTESAPAEIDDDLCKKWLESCDIPEMHNTKPSETSVHEPIPDPSLPNTIGNKITAVADTTADTDSRRNEDEIMVEAERISRETLTLHEDVASDHLEGVTGASDRDAATFTDHAIASSDGVDANQTVEWNLHLEKRLPSTTPNPDGESSEDSFKIVYAEPDSGDETESSESLS